jgi:predicted metal-binding membrane protein
MSALLYVNASRRAYVPAAGLILLAWLTLAIWSLSPYAEWLEHTRIEAIAPPLSVRLAIFTLGWTLMVVAMMLPTTLLLLARGLENKPFRRLQTMPAILAYLAVWAVFGSLSYLGDGALHEVVEQSPALAGFIAPGILLLAGIYQLTPIKRICLLRCRREGGLFTFLEHSSNGNRWTLGLWHGVSCLGSCWALMLLMFAFGGVNLVWMLLLGVIMAGERLTPKGGFLAQVLGVLLILSAAVQVFI